MTIDTEEQLEERLSRPTSNDVAAIAGIDGDLLVLGVGGKMGPSLVRLARRAANEAGVKTRIIAVARFTNSDLRSQLDSEDVETIGCDLLDTGALSTLPDAKNVIFMAAQKFGTTGSEYLTWAMNTFLPGLVAERYKDSRIVTFSTGNVYAFRGAIQGGAVEGTPVAPQGEYAQSALGRERMFEYGSYRWGTPVSILRLNYAIDLRYGVLVDIALAVHQRRPVDLMMGLVNVIWQGDANSMCLRSFPLCQSPPLVLNITGPETLSVRYLAEEFGKLFGVEPIFKGEETPSALLNNAANAHRLLGYPCVTAAELIDWVSHWVQSGGKLLNKPTHFQTRDGQF